MGIQQAVFTTCDHTGADNKPDCGEWEIAALSVLPDGSNSVTFPVDPKRPQAPTWGMIAPSAIVQQGVAQAPRFLCPRHAEELRQKNQPAQQAAPAAQPSSAPAQPQAPQGNGQSRILRGR